MYRFQFWDSYEFYCKEGYVCKDRKKHKFVVLYVLVSKMEGMLRQSS